MLKRTNLLHVIGLAIWLCLPLAACNQGVDGSDSNDTSGPMCVKGKRCGNTCIAQDKVCHVDDAVTSPDQSGPTPVRIGSAGSAAVPERLVGDPCEQDSDCAAPGLVPFCDTDNPGGYCSAVGCDPSSCGDGNACISTPPDSGVTGAACFKRCGTSEDCRDAYVCDAYVHQLDDRICLQQL